jgi:hypothetical protein
MYILKKVVYLNNDGSYRNVIEISPKPIEKALISVTKLIHREAISPFKQDNGCNYVILNPENTTELLCVDDIILLFNYILSNGFKIDNSIQQPFINDLICVIAK